MTLPAAAALLLVAALAGCSTVGSYYDRWFGSTSADRPSELTAFTPSAQLHVDWQASAGGAGRFAFAPAVSNGYAYVANAAGEIAKLELSSGKQAWRTATGTPISIGPGSNGRLVVVGTPRGEVIAVDDGGRLVWKTQLSGEVLSTPALFEDYVVVKTGDGRIFGLAAADGRRRWVYQRALPALTVYSPAGVTVINGGVFSGFPGGKLGALMINNGTLVWEATVSSPRGSTELERMTDIVGAPLVEGRMVCAAAFQGRAGCFDAATGNQLWIRNLSSVMPLGADTRYIYATDDKGSIHALDRKTGASIWKQDRLSGRRVTGATALGDHVVVADFQGYVHFLKRSDGDLAARIATDGSAIHLPPVSIRDAVLVQTRDGGVFRISAR